MTVVVRGDLILVSTDGDRVRERRERLGMDKKQLAEEAGVSRDTLAAIEEGLGFRRSSLTKIERALDAAEVEAGIEQATAPSETSGLIEFQVSPDGGFVVRGPIKDVDQLEAAVARLIRQLQQEPPPETPPSPV